MGQKPVLGKGLASLFPATTGTENRFLDPNLTPSNSLPGTIVQGSGQGSEGFTPIEKGNKDRHPGISHVSIDEIRANHYQPRREFDETALTELTLSILSNGIIQPLVVRRLPEGGFELIAGERRLRAARKAGLKQVPVVLRRSTDQESLELALIENIQREDLNCIEEALAYQQLIQEFSLTQEEIAQRVGKDRATIANHLRLLKLPEAIIDDLKKHYLSFGHGKILSGLNDQDLKLEVRKMIIENHLSVRETEALVEKVKQREFSRSQGDLNSLQSDDKSSKSPLLSRFSNLSHELRSQWSTKVEIRGTESKGRIIFYYETRQDLDRLLEGMRE